MDQWAGLTILPVTADRLGDLATVMGNCSTADKCWCAYWYRSNAAFKAGWGEANRGPLERLVRAGAEPGLVAYVEGEPAGWSASHRAAISIGSTAARILRHWTTGTSGR